MAMLITIVLVFIVNIMKEPPQKYKKYMNMAMRTRDETVVKKE
jgi:hypothetical protein